MLGNYYVSGFFRLNDQLAFARVSDDVLGRPQVKFWVWGANPWSGIEDPRKLKIKNPAHWSLEPCLGLMFDINEGMNLYATSGMDFELLEHWSPDELSDVYGDWSYNGYEVLHSKFHSEPSDVMDHLVSMLDPVIRLEEIKSTADLDPKTMQMTEHKKAAKALAFNDSIQGDISQLGFFEFFIHEHNGFADFKINHKDLQNKYVNGKMHQVNKKPLIYITYRDGAFDVPEPVFVYRKRNGWYLYNLEGIEDFSGPYKNRKLAAEIIRNYTA